MAEQLIHDMPAPDPAARKQWTNRPLTEYEVREAVRARLPEPLQPQPFVPRPPPRSAHYLEALRESDPAAPRRGRVLPRRGPPSQELAGLLDTAPIQKGAEVKTGRRFIRWRFVEDLHRNNTAKFMALIGESVRTTFYLRHVFAYWLQNVDNGDLILQYTNRGSPWFCTLAEAESWLNKKEEERVGMEGGTINRPTTKWVLDEFVLLDVKAVLDRQPLVGTGPLPAWLRNLVHSCQMVALDTFQNNLCLWRCLAVHRGARADHSTAAVRQLAQAYFNCPNQDYPKTSLDELDKVEGFLNENKPFHEWTGICVYEPEQWADDSVIWHLQRNAPAKVQNIVSIVFSRGTRS